MDIVEAMHWRYACKKFDPARSLSPDLLDALIEVFHLTATSYGLQPLQMVVVDNKELQEQLLPHSFNQRQVVDCSHVLVLCVNTDVDSGFVKEYFEMVHDQRGTDEEILRPFSNQLQNKFDKQEEDVTLEWAMRQCYIALGKLMVACAALRIDSCPMEGFLPDEYNRLLGLDQQNLHATLVLPVGYRAADDAFASFEKVRRPIDEIVHRR